MSYLLTTYHWPLLSRPRVAAFSDRLYMFYHMFYKVMFLMTFSLTMLGVSPYPAADRSNYRTGNSNEI